MQPSGSRFNCPSSSLELVGLLKQARRAVWASLVLGIAVHLSLTQIGIFGEEDRVVKPLTTKFIKRAPRLTKPLEMKKRPRPKRRRIERKMLSVKAKANRRDIGSRVQPLQVVRSLAKPRIEMGRPIAFKAVALEPQTLAEKIMGSKESKAVVDMSLEMMDIEALDTGQYQAMVIQDPNDKRNVRGFFHLAVIYSQSIWDYGLRLLAQGRASGPWMTYISLIEIRELITRGVNTYTGIRTDVSGQYPMNSPVFLSTPWVFVESLGRFTITDAEAENIGQYLTGGGFLYTENDYFTLGNGADQSFRGLYEMALQTVGLQREKDWILERLPNDHMLYHCFFDFDGPPNGVDNLRAGQELGGSGGVVRAVDYLEGITLETKLVAIHSNKDYSDMWYWGSSYYYRLHPDEPYPDNRRALQFGVNTIIFALTQEGSITRRVMNTVHY